MEAAHAGLKQSVQGLVRAIPYDDPLNAADHEIVTCRVRGCSQEVHSGDDLACRGC